MKIRDLMPTFSIDREPIVYGQPPKERQPDHDECRHCEKPITTFHYSAGWFHDDSGLPECELPPVVTTLTASPEPDYDDEECF